MTALADATVLVTGAARGIGRGLCRALHARGSRVIGVDRDTEGLDALASELGTGFHGLTVDFADPAVPEALATRLREEYGPVDVLINNAGVVQGRSLDALSGEQVEQTFRINTLAPIQLTRCLLPDMLARDHGHVVTIASAAGIAATARLSDYSASKAAMVGFDEALRLELRQRGSRVRTTVVCPYYINTGMFAGVKTRWRRLLPILDPDDVVRRILRAIERDRPRLVLPRLVTLAWPLRLLPTSWFDRIMDWLGITRSMAEFRGHSGERRR